MLQELITEIHQKERDIMKPKIDQIYDYFENKNFKIGDLSHTTLSQILDIIEDEKQNEIKQNNINTRANLKAKIQNRNSVF